MQKEKTEESKKIPFRLVRNSQTPLTEQVVVGLRQSIARGYYREGDILPSLEELAASLGVSMIVTRRAMKQLAGEGLVIARRNVGTVVLGKNRPLWRGQVLFIQPDGDDNYYQNMMVGTIRDALSVAGWLLLQVSVPRRKKGGYDFTRLDYLLDMGIVLAVQMYDRPDISHHLAKRSVKYLLIGDGPQLPRGCSGLIRIGRTDVVPEFVAHCVRAGIRKVLQVGMLAEGSDAVLALRAAGIAADEWIIPANLDYGRLEGTQRAAMEAFANRLAMGRDWLPDLLFFKDDYVAAGALTALSDAGVRIPEDVKVVTWNNWGNGPVFRRTLTRMEVNPIEHGKIAAKAILTVLAGNALPPNMDIGPDYRIGETFS